MEHKYTPKTAPAEFRIHLHPGGGGGPAGHLKGAKIRAKNTRGTLSRLWQYIRGQGKLLFLALLTVLGGTLLQIFAPYLLGIAIDQYLSVKVDIPGLARIVWLMAGVYLANGILSLFQQWVMIDVSRGAIRKIRQDLFAQFQALPVRYCDEHPHGDLMSRLTNDIENINNVLSTSLVQFLSSVLSLAGVTVMMFILHWQLALVCLSLLPLVGLLTRWIANHTRKGYKDYQMHLGSLNGLIEETINGQQVVKAFCREKAVIAAFTNTSRKLKQAGLKANLFAGFMGPVMNLMNNLNFAVTAFGGGIFVFLGKTSVGTIAAFLGYTKQFSRPLNHLAQLYNSIQSALAGAERVFEIMDENTEPPDAPEQQAVSSFKGDVHFQDVSFGYDPRLPVLKAITLHAHAGQTIALVGPTGAGKTTIVNLLTRFYDIDQGVIRIDGTDIRNIRRADLRRNLGIVLQDTFLFAATIKENIRYGRLTATEDEIREAALLSHAHTFIRYMPEGYNTLVSEAGANLSQGQRQLIAIARTLLAAPSVLILDEATSNIDTRTELQIQHAMLNLMQGRTCFVIAHRLSTIRNADLILVLKDGKIIEQGKHEALLSARGFYYRLCAQQFRGETI